VSPQQQRRWADLKAIYQASTLEQAEDATALAQKWDTRYPTISGMWLRHQIILFLCSSMIRRVIYTTNAIEFNRSPQKGPQDEGLPDDDATKLFYLALRNITRNGR